ncbi:hypothetical protein TeGR_g5924 [Tetraparma gracilis]|uniref:Prokaryotic-type class I peptide chain release factors domain-containing protein n=1 Tax=Tetraparma gracilis TaxID=2962635 RepID=A0ABQ6MEJ5_9STRA|nr:hypothetical protein TeGR_g5924 [Tetraparma gracilis]
MSFHTAAESPPAELLQAQALLDSRLSVLASITGALSDFQSLLELSLDGAGVSSLLPEASLSLSSSLLLLKPLRVAASFDGRYDAEATVSMSLAAGAGGTEATDWVEMLSRMYTRYFDARGWSYSLLSSSPGDVTGYKSLDYEVTGAAGDYVYGMLKKEKGAHRLVRVSPFNSAGKRMTTFAGVTVSPVIKDLGAKASVPNFERDCTVDTMRSGGKGGQNVNKVETAVRMTHVPSGLVVKVSKERTQQGNRRIASKLLQSRVLALMEDLRLEEVREINGDQVEAAWGRQIRNYVLHPYKQVKDLRSGYETADVGGVLDGKLDDILESVLTAR